ncbi:HXXEE domain-containing protein [Xiamenia xianingshaonis]|uniref:HXXEE domain-containing protein n=1 Tax=Xiamenia xianingshaonis TaxID=2682776 RepID=A0ABX0IFQ8_9ACTN|nr:HXXEE domain-containing protein [Xiamenia xianingshaonis]NHM13642.1 HXXEE domain-containing protein [Xiamenia xianingshaonis]
MGKRSFGRFILDYSLELFCALVILLTLVRILFFPELPLIQNLVNAFALMAVLHEFEEKRTPGGFFDLTQNIGGVDKSKLDAGLASSFVMFYWVVLLALPMMFPTVPWLFVILICLGIFEAVAHTGIIFAGHLGKFYSPGLVSAWLMCGLSIYCIFDVNAAGIMQWHDWVIGIALFLLSFVSLQRLTLVAAHMSYREFLTNVRNHALGKS